MRTSPAPQSMALSARQRFPLGLRIGFWFCILIATAVVIRRLIALAHPSPSGPPQLVVLDAFFANHAALTRAHIIPAMIFVLLLPLYFMRRFHDAAWLRRALLALGVVVGITAYAMSTDAVGGWTERSAVLFFNTLFLLSLARSFLQTLHDQRAEARVSMTRAIGILLGIATTRPVMGVFFATSRLTHLEPNQFFGIAFWIGFSINTITIELWLRRDARLTPLERSAVHPA